MARIVITVFLGRASMSYSFDENSLPMAILTSKLNVRQKIPAKTMRTKRERANSPQYFLFRCFDISHVKQSSDVSTTEYLDLQISHRSRSSSYRVSVRCYIHSSRHRWCI